jgi:hypothetical protein
MNNLPTSWNEVTVSQFLDIMNLPTDSTFYMKQINILTIITNTTIEDYEDMDIEELSTIIKSIKFLNKLPTHDAKKDINNLKLMNLKNLTLGEYIDLDAFYSENKFENLPKLCAILYRNYTHDEYNNVIYEKYDNIDIENRSDNYYDLPITYVYGILHYFNTYKQEILVSCQHLFNPSLDNEDDLDDEDLTDPEVVKEIAKEKTQAEWSWVLILHNLSNGDITKYDTILNMSFISILNNLSFRKLFAID